MNIADLLDFLACFGTNAGEAGYNAIWDFDGNGNIGVSDLLKLLEQFNPIGGGGENNSANSPKK